MGQRHYVSRSVCQFTLTTLFLALLIFMGVCNFIEAANSHIGEAATTKYLIKMSSWWLFLSLLFCSHRFDCQQPDHFYLSTLHRRSPSVSSCYYWKLSPLSFQVFLSAMISITLDNVSVAVLQLMIDHFLSFVLKSENILLKTHFTVFQSLCFYCEIS